MCRNGGEGLICYRVSPVVENKRKGSFMKKKSYHTPGAIVISAVEFDIICNSNDLHLPTIPFKSQGGESVIEDEGTTSD